MVTVSQNLHPKSTRKTEFWLQLTPFMSANTHFSLLWVQILLGIALATVIFDEKHEKKLKIPLFLTPRSLLRFQGFLVVFGPGYPQKGGGGGVPPQKKSKKPL